MVDRLTFNQNATGSNPVIYKTQRLTRLYVKNI
jgi:hypothetical protein